MIDIIIVTIIVIDRQVKVKIDHSHVKEFEKRLK
jgi:hypothetical protein